MNGQLVRSGALHFINTSRRFVIACKYFGTSHTVNSEVNLTQEVEIDDAEQRKAMEEIVRKRNKSRLSPQHRNIVHNVIPYRGPVADFHETKAYKRRLYGKYGAASGVDPSICWPSAEALLVRKEYESVAYPYTLQEMVKMRVQARAAEEELITRREEDISKKLSKLETWKRELHEKVRKKETEALQAKAKKDKLIEEVRRYFGYKVDPREERFKEMLEKKEKDERKLQKEARKKAREEKMLSKLQEKSDDPQL